MKCVELRLFMIIIICQLQRIAIKESSGKWNVKKTGEVTLLANLDISLLLKTPKWYFYGLFCIFSCKIRKEGRKVSEF